MSSTIVKTVELFKNALRARSTYSPRNTYVLFGLLWGLPIPLFSVGIDLLASGRAFAFGELGATYAERPVHFLFAAHPLLFAVVFGALGTIKQRQDHEIKTRNEELAVANDRLRGLDLMKKDFIANVSHELKTPLVAIMGYTEMLLEGRLGEINERQRNGLSVALRNVERLKRLIDELLDVARLESGKLMLEKSSFMLREVLDGVQGMFQPRAAAKSLAFAVTMEDPQVHVHADRERIERVLANLVSNAVKFTEAGGSIRIEAGRPERGRVKISVRDTGRGIPERFRPHLFGRFAQASPERGGTGLGLAIVKGILDAHASRIHVESREGRGTEIAFDLECKEGEGHGLQNGHGD